MAIPQVNLEELDTSCEDFGKVLKLFKEKHAEEWEKWDAGPGIQLPYGAQLSFQLHWDEKCQGDIGWNLKKPVTVKGGLFYFIG